MVVVAELAPGNMAAAVVAAPKNPPSGFEDDGGTELWRDEDGTVEALVGGAEEPNIPVEKLCMVAAVVLLDMLAVYPGRLLTLVAVVVKLAV